MEKLLIFMYKHWLKVLLVSAFVTAVCIIVVNHVCDSTWGRAASLLPFQLTVTAYYVSMLIVRRRYRRTDEIRYKAHFIRGIFYLLFLISWLVPLTALLAINI